jgi:hypothetical protein
MRRWISVRSFTAGLGEQRERGRKGEGEKGSRLVTRPRANVDAFTHSHSRISSTHVADFRFTILDFGLKDLPPGFIYGDNLKSLNLKYNPNSIIQNPKLSDPFSIPNPFEAAGTRSLS